MHLWVAQGPENGRLCLSGCCDPVHFRKILLVSCESEFHRNNLKRSGCRLITEHPFRLRTSLRQPVCVCCFCGGVWPKIVWGSRMSGRQTAFHLETRNPSVSEQHPNHCRVESCFSSTPSDGSHLGKDVAIATQGQQQVAHMS